jgi:3'-5' exoribonuclease
MEQQTLSTGKSFIRDLRDGQAVESVFLVRERARRQKRNGDTFLKLELGDATGAIEAVVWERVDEAFEASEPGSIVRVSGSFGVDARYGASLTVRALRAAEPGEYHLADIEEGPALAYDQMVRDLRDLVATIRDPDLRALLDLCFADGSPLWRAWSEAPAAKSYHQAYRHGLLEHCLSVAQGVNALSATFPGIDRELAVSGALLHDLGKTEAYASEQGAIELTDAGKLQGEIALGYYRVRRLIEELPRFPTEKAQALLHIILAHHGRLEHGSPVVPCTREATLVHMVDNLGGRLGSFDRIEKSLADGERWSAFDRALAGSAYFSPAETRAAA